MVRSHVQAARGTRAIDVRLGGSVASARGARSLRLRHEWRVRDLRAPRLRLPLDRQSSEGHRLAVVVARHPKQGTDIPETASLAAQSDRSRPFIGTHVCLHVVARKTGR